MQATQEYDVEQELSKSHAQVLEDLESGRREVVDLTTEEVPPEVPPILLAEMRGLVKSINDVLGPKHFKSDWKLKWEKKCERKPRVYDSGNKSNTSHQWKKRVAEDVQKVPATKANANWKIGNKFPRQKGAPMTDFAM